MVNLITGPRGSGKTQQMIDLANEKVKTSSGNVVFIKRSHKDTYSVDFNIRVIRMADYPDILTLEEFVGFSMVWLQAIMIFRQYSLTAF